MANELIPGGRSRCPDCDDELIAKCGDINTWHWAHAAGKDCDPWHEPETAWHRNWKSALEDEFPEGIAEHTIKCGGEWHRADFYIPNFDLVVELQHSNISSEEIAARELFYPRMVWVLDLQDVFDSGRFELRTEQGNYGPYEVFKWLHRWRSFDSARAPLIFDLAPYSLFEVRKHYGLKHGWGVEHVGIGAALEKTINDAAAFRKTISEIS